MLWRLHLKTAAKDPEKIIDHCLERKVVGIGWPLASPNAGPQSKSEYLSAAEQQYKGLSRSVASFLRNPKIGDLIWIRSRRGVYYLAKIVGEWRYEGDEVARSFDVVNVYPVEFVTVGKIENVPGKVRAAFRPSNTFQRISDTATERYSEALYRESSNLPPLLIGNAKENDLFSLLSDRDIEDLVLIYLQVEGWILIPSTREKDTQHTEFRLVHATTAEAADVQVKSGRTPLDASCYKDSDKVFLFAASGIYGNEIPTNVSIVLPEDLIELVKTRPELLPKSVTFWMSILAQGQSMISSTLVPTAMEA